MAFLSQNTWGEALDLTWEDASALRWYSGGQTYEQTGTATFDIVLTKFDQPTLSVIDWVASTPPGTDITAKSIFHGIERTVESGGTVIQPGESISDGDILTLVFELSTLDNAVTPELLEIELSFVGIADSSVLILQLPSGNVNSIQNAAGDVTVTYAGGTLAGADSAIVEQFEMDFTPVGLAFKGGQHISEHIEISNISASSTLMHVYYTETQANEHIEIAAISATGTLTHIHDI